MKPRILVTGGAGFIGSHLVESLHQDNFRVVVVDNLVHGQRCRIPTGVEFIKKDIRDHDLAEVFKKYYPRTVFHLAAQQDVSRADKDPLFDASVNIIGTINVLESCRRAGVKRVIYADSVAGFGQPQNLPITADQVRQPLSFYGISKHTAEHYFQVYQQNYGLEFVNLVLANVYGPRQDPLGEGGVVAIFSYRMTTNRQVVIHGDGKQTRDFIYVKDAVSAFIQTIKYGKNQFLMIGSGKKTSINQLFNLIKQITNYNKEPVYSSPRPGDVRESIFSLQNTKAKLNWQPEYSLKQGLKQTIQYFSSKAS